MSRTRIDADALYAALDTRRRAANLRWCDVAKETGVGASTFSRMGVQHLCPDVHGLARMLLWLGDTDLKPYMRQEATPE